MKRIKNVDGRLFISFIICILLSTTILTFLGKSIYTYENTFFSRYIESERKQPIKNHVFVVDIPAIDDESIIDVERNKINNQRLNALQTMISGNLKSADGVFILQTEILSKAAVERQNIPLFREAGNVYWHYNTRNVGYYHQNDKCVMLKYIDSNRAGQEYFEILGEGKYSKNYLPYGLMTMHGGKVHYDKKKLKYTVKEKSGNVIDLYAQEDGFVRVREASRTNVEYMSFGDFYEYYKSFYNNDIFENAVIFFQDSNKNSYLGTDGKIHNLADYYIDVLGTIQNEATVPGMEYTQAALIAIINVVIICLLVICFRTWFSTIFVFLECLLTLVAAVFMAREELYRYPVFALLLCTIIAFFIMMSSKHILTLSTVRNLPIDAVIRFASNIMNIDHAVSYSEYLMKNRSGIEEDISASLLLPVMDNTSFLLKEIAEENHRNRQLVETEFWGEKDHRNSSVIQIRSNLFRGIRFIAFVPLPVFDMESENVTYTAIGLKRKLKPQKASYISMMLFSMYIYFRAQHERGEHQRMYFSMLSLMISVIDAKDPVTAGHSQRVANISRDIGIWMHLSKSQQFDLEFTALLHDIGKIGVSDYVLNKPSVYTQSDFEQMKYHTIRGAEMLSEVGISEEIIDGVRHHHERIDGKGYPDGLKGDEMTLFAKIIKIADVYDALTSKRQYKEAWAKEKALRIIYKGRGTEFDKEIADVFISHMSSPGWIPPVDEKFTEQRIDPNSEKAVKIAVDFYQKYSNYLSVEYPIPSRKAEEVDFECKHGFMGYDWGETFNNAAFLEEKPMILAYEKGTKTLVFGQSSKGNGVSSIYYYFFKGFVNMGVYLLVASKTKEVIQKVTDIFGEAHVVNDQMMLFIAQKNRVIFYHTVDEKCLLFYISDYMCANYLFDAEGEGK